MLVVDLDLDDGYPTKGCSAVNFDVDPTHEPVHFQPSFPGIMLATWQMKIATLPEICGNLPENPDFLPG